MSSLFREKDGRLRSLSAEHLDEAVETDFDALSGVADFDVEERPGDPFDGADQPRIVGIDHRGEEQEKSEGREGGNEVPHLAPF